MRRKQVEALLVDAYDNNMGTDDFKITVPYAELSAALNILKHLELAGQFSSHSRRDAEAVCGDCPEGQCGCVMIYGYTG